VKSNICVFLWKTLFYVTNWLSVLLKQILKFLSLRWIQFATVRKVCKSLIYTLFFVLYFPKMFAFVRQLGFLLVTPFWKCKKGQRCANNYEHNRTENQQDKLNKNDERKLFWNNRIWTCVLPSNPTIHDSLFDVRVGKNQTNYNCN
jgi:hypothetical protein